MRFTAKTGRMNVNLVAATTKMDCFHYPTHNQNAFLELLPEINSQKKGIGPLRPPASFLSLMAAKLLGCSKQERQFSASKGRTARISILHLPQG